MGAREVTLRESICARRRALGVAFEAGSLILPGRLSKSGGKPYQARIQLRENCDE